MVDFKAVRKNTTARIRSLVDIIYRQSVDDFDVQSIHKTES